jgi:hypothetical protein
LPGFDSHFSDLSGAAFDERLAFNLARRGFNTVIFGACLDGLFTPQCTVATLAQLDALGRYGLFGLVGAQFDSGPSADTSMVVQQRDTTAPPMVGLSAYIQNIRNHPALLGYYSGKIMLCHACCAMHMPKSSLDCRGIYATSCLVQVLCV